MFTPSDATCPPVSVVLECHGPDPLSRNPNYCRCVAMSDRFGSMQEAEGGSALPSATAVRLAILGGLVTAAFAAFAPGVLFGLALAYPAGLAFAAATGGSVDGRRTRRWLIVAASAAIAGVCGIWLSSHAPAIALIGWATVAGVVTACLLARAFQPTVAKPSATP